MAIVTHNIVTQGLSGKLGNLLVFRQWAGKTIVSVKPDRSKVELSAKQKQQNSRFKEAVLYARNALKDPSRKAAYAARANKGQSAYHVAIAEYMRQDQAEVLPVEEAPVDTAPMDTKAIDKVPFSQPTVSTAKRRQEGIETTNTPHSLNTKKVQKPIFPYAHTSKVGIIQNIPLADQHVSTVGTPISMRKKSVKSTLCSIIPEKKTISAHQNPGPHLLKATLDTTLKVILPPASFSTKVICPVE